MRRLVFEIPVFAAIAVFMTVQPALGAIFTVGDNEGFFQNAESVFREDADGNWVQINPFAGPLQVGDVFLGIFNVQNISGFYPVLLAASLENCVVHNYLNL